MSWYFAQKFKKNSAKAYSWYESQKLGLGDEFFDCVDETVNLICQMPESYAVAYRDIRGAIVLGIYRSDRFYIFNDIIL
ncbi:hypothetical protein [Nostoc sp. ChiQUE01b]|uniref:hypothetical protein n=1 Tax=Nostoc sp. ChiQUE01b TaxID=3075376 RepID=UPI002AD38E0F|nr:hypothetical protein [Nostoc sp. ChiQUE01b]MDZ8262047.1 hypothetical protein [Nostoc sp. ChiQUE01b]